MNSNTGSRISIYSITALCLVATQSVLTRCQLLSAGERPNIVLMMCDDLGWGDPQCFNAASVIQTPHIDAMASDGLKFNRFYAAAPVCSPTRGSCLTGRHPYRYGVYFANTGKLKKEEITLPELLHDAGYATGHFGKWHLGTLTKDVIDANRGGPRGANVFSPPQEHGYDVCFVTESKVPTYDPLLKPANAKGTGWDYLRDRTNAKPYGTRYWDESGKSVEGSLLGDDSKIIMDRALPFIDSAVERDQPFLAVIWFHAPHLPVVAGPEFVAPYAQYDSYQRNYYGCISALDMQVGRLRGHLKELGVSEQTMVWFCSDNGPEGSDRKAPGLQGHLRGRKRSLYDGGVRVPGILDWPGHVNSGTETDFPAVTSDYLPTILDALDLTYPSARPLDGISLVPLLEGDIQQRSKPIGFQSRNQQSWVKDRYKLITVDAGKSWELFDMHNDPSESVDLSEQEESIVAVMKTELEAWLASCKASDAGSDYAE